MQKNSLDGMRVAIIVGDDFEQVEMTEPERRIQRLSLHSAT